MTSNIERRQASNIRQALEERYPQPGWLSEAGQKDRHAEGRHCLEMRGIGRDIELQAAEVGAQLLRELALSDADAQLLTDAKLKLKRAKQESTVLAGGDPELEAEYSVLDGEHFQRRRAHLLFGLE